MRTWVVMTCRSVCARPSCEHAAMGIHVLPKPHRVGLGTRVHVGDQIGVENPFPLADLDRVGLDRPVMAAAEHVDQLVFDQAAGNRRVVLQHEQWIDRTGEAHLLRKAAAGGISGGFAGQRVAAAGVGPQAARVILRKAAPLQQELTPGVAHQHRDGAMLEAALVGLELARGADLDVIGIDQNDRIVVRGTGHSYDFPPSLSLRVFHTTCPASEVAEIGLTAVSPAVAGSEGLASCFFRLLANWFISAVAVAWIMPTPRPYCATAPDSVRSVCTRTLDPAAEGSSRNVAAAWAEPRPLASVPWAFTRAV